MVLFRLFSWNKPSTTQESNRPCPWQLPLYYNSLGTREPPLVAISTGYNEPQHKLDYLLSFFRMRTTTRSLYTFKIRDNWQEQMGHVTILRMETRVRRLTCHTCVLSNLPGAIAEALLLICAIRSPNTVKMSIYAPSFVNSKVMNRTLGECFYYPIVELF